MDEFISLPVLHCAGGASLTADNCTSVRNKQVGYFVGTDCMMKLTDCSSEHDRSGCVVHRGNLTAHNMAISNCTGDGVALTAGSCVLQNCTVSSCRRNRVSAQGEPCTWRWMAAQFETMVNAA